MTANDTAARYQPVCKSRSIPTCHGEMFPDTTCRFQPFTAAAAIAAASRTSTATDTTDTEQTGEGGEKVVVWGECGGLTVGTARGGGADGHTNTQTGDGGLGGKYQSR